MEFLKNNLGFVIGLIIGALIVLFNFAYVFVNLAVMFGCAFLGKYVQKNKQTVKTALKNFIDKI